MKQKRQKIKFGASILVTAVMTMALILPAAQAAVVTNEDVPISVDIINPCTGETITLSGNLHLSFSVTNNGAGGFHLSEHQNFQGISGIDSSGVKYQATGVFNSEFNVQAGEEYTSASSYNLISQGAGDNVMGHTNFHYTVNPDGTVTAYVDNSNVECK
jgi:hypothetical protein